MIERGEAPGGNHTWCFHAGDIREEARAWLDPLVVCRWDDGYDVAFPDLARHVRSPYALVSSERMAERVTRALDVPGSRLVTRATATEIAPDRVTYQDADGASHTIEAAAVIDARGPDRSAERDCGWQKFVGHELALAAPHGLERPILMDATVPQTDGFRFFYVLPIAPDRVLVEDTYFSDRPYLDVSELRAEIAAYVARRGWTVTSLVREEVGVLPLPWRAAPPSPSAPLVAGYAGGWFHPVTGYSFPIAARLAQLVAAHSPQELFGPALASLSADHARQLRFALKLNHMLFRWFPPDQRYHVLERFYRRLPEASVRRFYALELTGLDRARILVGRPPRGLSWRAALAATTRPEVS